MNLPPETLAKTLCTDTAGFNLIFFKDADINPGSDQHLYVTISLGDNQHILLAIVTTQMQKLAKRYSYMNEKALDSLVPLSPSDFNALKKACVVNCNNTELISTKDLVHRVSRSRNPDIFSCRHFNSEFTLDLKTNIIKAIDDSPIVKPVIKQVLAKVKTVLLK